MSMYSVSLARQVLERCNLYTCDQLQRDRMRKAVPNAVTVSANTSRGDNSAHMSPSQVSTESCNADRCSLWDAAVCHIKNRLLALKCVGAEHRLSPCVA